MNSLAFDVRPQFSSQGLVGDEVDAPPEQILKVELHAEIA
jgi:hypothetical protein